MYPGLPGRPGQIVLPGEGTPYARRGVDRPGGKVLVVFLLSPLPYLLGKEGQALLDHPGQTRIVIPPSGLTKPPHPMLPSGTFQRQDFFLLPLNHNQKRSLQ